MNIEKGAGEGIGAARKTGTERVNNGVTTAYLGRTPGRRSSVVLFAPWLVFMIGGCNDGLNPHYS